MSEMAQAWADLLNFSIEIGDTPSNIYSSISSSDSIDNLEELFPHLPFDFIEFISLTSNISKNYGNLNVILGFELMNTQQIIDAANIYKMIMDSMDEDQNNIIEGQVYPSNSTSIKAIDPFYLPFANDFRSTNLVIDTNPERGYSQYQITHMGSEDSDRYIISSSLTEFFKLALKINRDPHMKLVTNSSKVSVRRWVDDDGLIITSLLDLLPEFYQNGWLLK